MSRATHAIHPTRRISGNSRIRLALALLCCATAASAFAGLPDDLAGPPVPNDPRAERPQPRPKGPGFQLEHIELVCVNAMSRAGYLYSLKTFTQGPFSAGLGLQWRIVGKGTWPLPVNNQQGSQVTYLPPGNVALTGGQIYQTELLLGSPPTVFAPYSRTLVAPVCGRGSPPTPRDSDAPMPGKDQR